ncbi:MAG: crossover junction endodeoxyribonuclease RuvC [Xanthomonadales bacterium]|nr:crossover junction endodeoxyribonuclease RuvC [Xanthomonadales bacterium]
MTKADAKQSIGPVRILGIDPGSVATGIGCIDFDPRGPRHVHHAVIACGGGPFPERLKIIFEGVTALIQELRPDQVAVENVFVSRNADSALKLGQARGAAICAAVAMQKPVFEYAPRQVKKAIVGRGGAEKRQIQHMIRVLLNVEEKLAEDAADALGVAICHAHYAETERRIGSDLRRRA